MPSKSTANKNETVNRSVLNKASSCGRLWTEAGAFFLSAEGLRAAHGLN
ncbi:hypothetical protein HMPREF9413_1351 [Paenibacillus sp. HGF7]|nr:hypothetical protein HMPREF9413_1351 [Paenibacillus sp. HGF7]